MMRLRSTLCLALLVVALQSGNVSAQDFEDDFEPISTQSDSIIENPVAPSQVENKKTDVSALDMADSIPEKRFDRMYTDRRDHEDDVDLKFRTRPSKRVQRTLKLPLSKYEKMRQRLRQKALHSGADDPLLHDPDMQQEDLDAGAFEESGITAHDVHTVQEPYVHLNSQQEIKEACTQAYNRLSQELIALHYEKEQPTNEEDVEFAATALQRPLSQHLRRLMLYALNPDQRPMTEPELELFNKEFEKFVNKHGLYISERRIGRFWMIRGPGKKFIQSIAPKLRRLRSKSQAESELKAQATLLENKAAIGDGLDDSIAQVRNDTNTMKRRAELVYSAAASRKRLEAINRRELSKASATGTHNNSAISQNATLAKSTESKDSEKREELQHPTTLNRFENTSSREESGGMQSNYATNATTQKNNESSVFDAHQVLRDQDDSLKGTTFSQQSVPLQSDPQTQTFSQRQLFANDSSAESSETKHLGDRTNDFSETPHDQTEQANLSSTEHAETAPPEDKKFQHSSGLEEN